MGSHLKNKKAFLLISPVETKIKCVVNIQNYFCMLLVHFLNLFILDFSQPLSRDLICRFKIFRQKATGGYKYFPPVRHWAGIYSGVTVCLNQLKYDLGGIGTRVPKTGLKLTEKPYSYAAPKARAPPYRTTETSCHQGCSRGLYVCMLFYVQNSQFSTG